MAILDRDEFSARDRDRLILAVSRIQSAMAAAGLDNGKSRSTVVQFPAKRPSDEATNPRSSRVHGIRGKHTGKTRVAKYDTC